MEVEMVILRELGELDFVQSFTLELQDLLKDNGIITKVAMVTDSEGQFLIASQEISYNLMHNFGRNQILHIVLDCDNVRIKILKQASQTVSLSDPECFNKVLDISKELISKFG